MTHDAPIRRFQLERYLAGELPRAEQAEVDARLAASAEARAELEALRQDGEAFASERPYASFRIEHERRKERQAQSAATWPTGRTVVWLAALAASTAAVVVLAVPRQQGPSDTTRIKGSGVGLTFTLASADGVQSVGHNGMLLRPGTTVQLAYDAGGYDHLAILGIDAAGRVAVYYPDPGSTLAALPSGGAGPVPFSLELDAAPGVERFVAVFAHEPHALAPIVAAARQVAQGEPRPLRLAEGLGQSMIWVRKE